MTVIDALRPCVVEELRKKGTTVVIEDIAVVDFWEYATTPSLLSPSSYDDAHAHCAEVVWTDVSYTQGGDKKVKTIDFESSLSDLLF